MAEPRRIELMSMDEAPVAKKPRKKEPILRLELTLTESTDQTCPEFSYAELSKSKQRERAEQNGDSFHDADDPFGDSADHDKLLAIAKQFEAKYGCDQKKSSKKKSKFNSYNLGELGDGYDEDDPFVDNSEAYDEVVPETWNTERGGFYINTGQLTFRENSDEEDSLMVILKKKKKLKKINKITKKDAKSKIIKSKNRLVTVGMKKNGILKDIKECYVSLQPLKI